MWRIGELLVQKKLISWKQLEEALAERDQSNELTGDILVRKGFVSQALLYRALAEQHDMRFVELKKVHLNPKALELIPSDLAWKHFLFPVEVLDDMVILAVDNPLAMLPEDEIKTLGSFRDIQTVLCLPNDLRNALEVHYGKKVEKQ